MSFRCKIDLVYGVAIHIAHWFCEVSKKQQSLLEIRSKGRVKYLCLFGKHLSPETVAHFGLNYRSSGKMSGRIIVPIHNEGGMCIGHASWLTGDLVKPEADLLYKLSPIPRNKEVLFNLHRIKERVRGNILIVVEKITDVFDLYQKGVINVVAIMGMSMSKEQENLIVKTIGEDGKVLLQFGDDEAAKKRAWETYLRLGKKVWVEIE